MAYSSKNGFTLIELLIVIAIITILSTIGIVRYVNITQNVKDSAKKAAVDSITKAFEVKYSNNNTYGDLTPNNNKALFSSGQFPTPPEGGQYSILQNQNTSGFTICAPISNTTPCLASSSTCFCLSSTQADPPKIGEANISLVTNYGFSGNNPGSIIDYNGNGVDNRFAVAGSIGPALDIYYYVWEDFNYPSKAPPNQPAAIPNHKFAWMPGKMDGRWDGKSCTKDPLCTQANIDTIFAAEEPKVRDVLSLNVNKGGVWIIGNEANVYSYLAPDLYAYQFKRYYSLIKSFDPTAKVTNSGLLYFSNYFDNTYYDPVTYLGNFLNALSASGIKPDIYNVHFYPGYILDQASFNHNVQQAKDFKNYVNSKDPGKPIWVTEFGVNTSTSNETVAAYMDTMLQYFISEPQYQRWFWFAGTSADWNITDWYTTSLTKSGLLTTIGQHYKNWMTQGVSVPLPTTAPPPNILANSGFENQLNSWGCSGTGGTCSVDSIIKHSDNYSAKIINTGGWWGWQLGQGNISASNGEQFCLSGWVKRGSADPNFWVSISLQGGAPSYKEQDLWANSTTDWQFLKSTVTVGSDWVLPVQVFIRTWSIGTAWFDEIKLSRGPC